MPRVPAASVPDLSKASKWTPLGLPSTPAFQTWSVTGMSESAQPSSTTSSSLWQAQSAPSSAREHPASFVAPGQFGDGTSFPGMGASPFAAPPSGFCSLSVLLLVLFSCTLGHSAHHLLFLFSFLLQLRSQALGPFLVLSRACGHLGHRRRRPSLPLPLLPRLGPPRLRASSVGVRL